MWPTLLIMAAWMWSRYGWLKQIDAFWPHGETILEYSIFDAIRAWFSHVVLVIRESFHEDFLAVFADTFQDKIQVTYIYQEINPVVPWFDLPIRKKPRWTGHAVLAAKDVIDGPFCVINADDWYGLDAFRKMSDYLGNIDTHMCGMVGYILENTLSPHGTVNRWVCKVNEQSHLLAIQEHLKIWYVADIVQDINGTPLSPQAIVSMNFRWFDASIVAIFEQEFHAFLNQHKDEEWAEFFITTPPNTFVKEAWKVCDVLVSNDSRYGVTYAEDKPFVQKAITELVESWVYPNYLRK